VTSFLGRQSSRLPTGHMPRARSCRAYGARPCPRQKRTFTPSVAMHIHTAWLAASRAVSGTAMQLTSSYSHEGHEFSDHVAELQGHPQVDRGSRISLGTGHIKRFRRSSVVHGQDRDESRPTPRRALDVCAPDRRSAWTTGSMTVSWSGRGSGYSVCTYRPGWYHPAAPVHARRSGRAGVCGRHRRAGRPGRRWPRGKCAGREASQRAHDAIRKTPVDGATARRRCPFPVLGSARSLVEESQDGSCP
jgi:hypothetical protein